MGRIQKIAIPVMNNLVSEKLEQTSAYLIFTVFRDAILKEKFIHTTYTEMETRAKILKENGVSEILTKAVKLSTIEILNKMKINVFVGVQGNDPYSVIQEYMQGKLVLDDDIIIV